VYRQRQFVTVKDLDGWNEIVSVVDDVNKLCAERGWTQGTLMTRTFGTFNELCLEIDFPDLATFESEMKAWMADPDTGPLMRRLDAVETATSGHDELWMEAEPVKI
jgi:hypothetical protein